MCFENAEFRERIFCSFGQIDFIVTGIVILNWHCVIIKQFGDS